MSTPSRQSSEMPQGLLPSHNESSGQWRAQALSSLSTTISMATKVARSRLKPKAKPLLPKIPAQLELSCRRIKSRTDTVSKESFRTMKGHWGREEALEKLPITISKPFKNTRLRTISMATLCIICSVRAWIMSSRNCITSTLGDTSFFFPSLCRNGQPSE